MGIDSKRVALDLETSETEGCRFPQATGCRTMNAIPHVAFCVFQVYSSAKQELFICLFQQTKAPRNPGVRRWAERRPVIHEWIIEVPVARLFFATSELVV